MSLEQKFSDEDIEKYTDIFHQSASRMRLLGVKKWCCANVLSDNKTNMYPGKFANSKRFLAVLPEHIKFSVN